MKISNANLNRLTRWELHQFMTDALIYANSHLEGMPELYTNKLAELQTAYDTFDDVLAQEQQTAPEALIEAEEKRDHAIRKIYNLIKEYSDFPYEQDKEDAAKHLLRVFKPYGTGSSIATMGQDSETSVLNNLFQDIEKSEETETCFVTLNLMYVLNELKHSNSIFAVLQRNRDVSQAEFVAGALKNARNDAQMEFLSYAEVVNALCIVEGNEKYAVLKQTVNSLLKKYVDRAKQRTKKKEEETEPEVIE